jgi:prepilin peptidase CpaA
MLELDDTRLVTVAGVALLMGLLALAIWHDIRARRIPNLVIVCGITVALLLHSFLPQGSGLVGRLPGGIGVYKAAGGFAIGLGLLLPLYALRAAGGGDVKLMAMVGACTGPIDILGVTLMTFVAGSVLALAITWRAGAAGVVANNVRGLARAVLTKGTLVDTHHDAALKIPYSIAIGLGTGLWLTLKYYG